MPWPTSSPLLVESARRCPITIVDLERRNPQRRLLPVTLPPVRVLKAAPTSHGSWSLLLREGDIMSSTLGFVQSGISLLLHGVLHIEDLLIDDAHRVEQI